MWIQLDEKSRQANATLLETVQQLRVEMISLRTDNKRLRHEKERILKSLSDRQNQRGLDPSVNNGNRTATFYQREGNAELEGGQDNEEGRSDNVSDDRKVKGKKMNYRENLKK